jgi:quercetin dioxygenase-like cupin family protein
MAWALLTCAASAGVACAAGTTQTGHVLQFENDKVRVWKSLILPNSPLPFHRHEHPRVLIALQGGKMKILEETGPGEAQDCKTGNAYWLPANAPGTRHQDVNVGDAPIEMMVVELSRGQ